MRVYVKNMVCSRCKMVVRDEFEKAGLRPLSVDLGEVGLDHEPDKAVLAKLNERLAKLGFEIIDDRKGRIVEKIKTSVIDLIHHQEQAPNIKLSTHLADQLNYDAGYLSNLFSEVEGTTIERYFIAQKIEKVKELIMYDELSLAQIADKLGYSSAAYLSAQFKKETGLTPSFYKSLRENTRRNIEDI